MTQSKTYNSWRAMHDRCRHHARYKRDNITVCSAWMTFDGFLADMGLRPANTSLDRMDGTKGYTKENCRWATAYEQVHNRPNFSQQGVKNANVKLTPQQVLYVRQFTGNKRELADNLGVTVSTIRAIQKRRLWRSLKDD